MDLREYLNDDEQAIVGSRASEGDSTSTGKLVCTSQRVVFTQGEEVIDIDADRIDAIKFTASTYPSSFIYATTAFLLLGVLATVVALLAPGIRIGFALIAFVIGAFVFVAGLLFMKETLEIHTGASEFTFKARGGDLGEFPGAVRQDN